MPLPSQTILTIESLFVLCGCVLLWRHVISAEARKIARERRDNMPAWRISGSDFLLFLFSVIAGGFLFIVATSLLLTSTMSHTMSLIIQTAAMHAGMITGVIFFYILSQQKWGTIFAGLKFVRIIGYGLTTILIILPVVGVAAYIWQNLMSHLGIELQQQTMVEIFLTTKSPKLLACLILLATIAAPLSEELIFRAGIFRYLRTRIPRWGALVLANMLFAILHDATITSFAPLFILGIIFSLAYERTGNIAVPMIAHGLFNLNTILLVLSGVNV